MTSTKKKISGKKSTTSKTSKKLALTKETLEDLAPTGEGDGKIRAGRGALTVSCRGTCTSPTMIDCKVGGG